MPPEKDVHATSGWIRGEFARLNRQMRTYATVFSVSVKIKGIYARDHYMFVS